MQTLNEVKTLELSALAASEAAPAPVRVCFLIDDLATAGTETQLLALIARLDRARVQPYLCLLRGQGEVSRALEPDGCQSKIFHVTRNHGRQVDHSEKARKVRAGTEATLPRSGFPVSSLRSNTNRLIQLVRRSRRRAF